MKVLIVFALVAVFQGCQSATIVDVDESVHDYLESIEYVPVELESVIDSMEADGQRVINGYLAGATAGACVIALQKKLKDVSKQAITDTDRCIHLELDIVHDEIDLLLTSIDGRFTGLLGIVGNLLATIFSCLLNLLSIVASIKAIPPQLLQDIVDIIDHMHDLLVVEVLCSNDAVKEASSQIADILLKVFDC